MAALGNSSLGSKGTAVVTTPTDTQILITREFAAPRRAVFRVLTEPELIKKWWSGGFGEVVIAEVDLRVGGHWRYVMTADGQEVGFHGEYREVVPGERFVCTEIYEGVPGGSAPALCSYDLIEEDGRTTLRLLTEMASKEDRDALLASGMEAGVQAGYDLLEELAISLPE
jgi:uncharacterized protein YndB with AHSA1/START domain